MGAPAFDVVAVVGSSAGVEALATVLFRLPADFPVPVVVVQHLDDQGRALTSILRRRIRLPVAWATEGQKLEAGQVVLCPPASGLVVLPDGTLSVIPSVQPQDRPCDILLESLAEAHADRALAVILAGRGRDGAAGARAMRAAGGTVVAETSSLPTAAVGAGAVDLALPLEEIGPVVVDIVGGRTRPTDRSDDAAAAARVFVGDSEAAAYLRAVDWPSTPLGPVGAWPVSLAAAVRTMLDSPLPMIVHWGPELVVVPNDAARALLGGDFARVVGRPLRDAWPGDWAANDAVHRDVLASGRPRVVEDAPFVVDGDEVFLTSSLSVLRGDEGGPAGTLSTAIDTTARVIARRRDEVLQRLQVGAAGATTVADAAERAVIALQSDPGLVPFALVYLLDGPRRRAQLAAVTGLEPGGPTAPRVVELTDEGAVWPIATVTRQGSTAVAGADDGLGDRPPALVLPLRLGHDDRVTGVVVVGIDARRPLDPVDRAFLDEVATRLTAALTEARSRQHERARQEAEADVDRAKTEFLAHISHQFRTPLTLLLAPLEAARARAGDLPDGVGADLDLAHRNALRLLRMVQSLLDFSQIEGGRQRAAFAPTDLSALTRDLAAMFQGAADAAGLRLVVDCPPLPEPVWVDPLLWERIVSNLLSNAIKFTLQGQVSVTLRLLPGHAELEVSDTGSGISDADLPHVLERFHRSEGVPARTREGTGIGVALVDDLVRLHHGRVRVRSRLGEGSTFTVWVPRGRRQDGSSTAGVVDDAPGSLSLARSHADEALAWSASAGAVEADPRHPPLSAGRVLVVDDNSDLRAYLGRLLGRHWQVDVAADGIEARARLASADPPDVVVADVMMAEVDGLVLLDQLRAEPGMAGVPVILLSARAGEDDVVAGLRAGADDYIVKPFSSRELVARVGAQIELGRLRRHRELAVHTGDERLQLALRAAGFVAFEVETTTDRVTIIGGEGDVLHGVSDEDLARHILSLDRPVGTDQASTSEQPVRVPGGDVRWIRSVAHRLPAAPRRLFGMSTDVTDRHRADQALVDATTQLRADIEVLARFQELTGRLSAASRMEQIDALLEEILDATIELQGADGGTVCLLDPATGEIEVAVRRDAGDAGDPGDAEEDDYRVLQPAGAGTQSMPLLDRVGTPIGALTTTTRHPQTRSDLELRLAELYVRQAVGLVAMRSDAGAGGATAAAEDAAQEAAHQAGGEEAADQAAADAEEVGVDGLDLTDDDHAVGPDGGEVGG